MPDPDALTAWQHRLQAGERSATVKWLWVAYFDSMVWLARHRFGQKA